MLTDKTVVVFGGTGSLGKLLVRRLLTGECGNLRKLLVVSRDEAKQHFMRLEMQRIAAATDEVLYKDYEKVLQFHIGDVRDYSSVLSAMRNADYVFNAAALKQVPACEYFPFEAVQTNIVGPENIVRAIRENALNVRAVIGVSTDKACKPVNVMGMTKAIQERLYARANLDCPNTRFSCVRYGNVIASRGSVIPLFREQIAHGGPVTLTTPDMTRFLLSLDQAVDTIIAALRFAGRGEIFVPRCPAAKIVDVADVLIGEQQIEKQFVGIRPGEKLHESLISIEEGYRTVERSEHYVILPILPELCPKEFTPYSLCGTEYDSKCDIMNIEQIELMLKKHDLLLDDSARKRIRQNLAV